MKTKSFGNHRFGRWFKFFKTWCSQNGLQPSERAFLKMADFILKHPKVQVGGVCGSVSDFDLLCFECLCVGVLKFRRMTHYFLDEGVAAFCEKGVKELNENYAGAFPGCEKIKAIGSDSEINGGFVLHFPASEKRFSIVCFPNLVMVQNKHFAKSYFYGASDGENIHLISKKSELERDESSAKMDRFLFGFSLYALAFPDKIKTMDAGFLPDSRHYGDKRICVERSDCVEEEESGSVSPHWRRGHFNYLSSDRFTKKRFQSVYIRGCFVRGTALGVEASGNVQDVVDNVNA